MIIEVALGAVVLAGSLGWRLVGQSPMIPIQLWQAITYTGVAVLAIGLVRDLGIVLKRYRSEKPVPPRCSCEKLLCLESTVGGLMVTFGLAALLMGVQHEMPVHVASLGIEGGLVLIASGLGKDVVVVFRREKDHQNVIPW